MSIFKTRAVVLKTKDINEADKLVWLYSENGGKISSIAHGAKKSRSKLLSITQPFSLVDFVLFKGKSLYTINEGKNIESFQGLLSDITTLTYASYLCELTDITMLEGEVNQTIFENLVKALYLLKNKVGDFDLILRHFEMSIFKATGYEINFDRCSVCQSSIITSNYISVDLSGGLCNNCVKENGHKISYAAYNLLRFLSKTQIERVCRVSISKELSEELYKLLLLLITNNYGKEPNSLKTLKLIKGSD